MKKPIKRHYSEYKLSDQSILNKPNSLDNSKELITNSEIEPIAIIGIGCRFPGGANDPDSFWQVLCQGVDAVVDVPADRWSTNNFYHPKLNQNGKTVSCRGGFLKEIDKFDAQFFGISPREAMHLDPQQRLLMEVSWEAFEDAGQVVGELAGKNVSVFMGAFTMDQQLFKLKESNRDLIESQTSTGSMMTLVANRLSHAFDLRGPSVAIDTACSSSLVAVHLACQSLRNNESSLALAGGVNAMFLPEFTIVESKAGMLSPNGLCKTFDADADGYVRGEGGGVVVLKPLTQALADGNTVYAVIRGSAVNQDGRTNGITVPRGDSQQAVMRSAYQQAGVLPSKVGYMEAHGTGTPVGDPIEANAIGAVLSEQRASDKPCYIGSIKTNIGHTEAAAGVAGLIKAALCLHFREIPPHLHLRKVNPKICFEELGLQVATELTDWPDDCESAYAGVNSFGFGGTNAHVVLEEAPDSQKIAIHDHPQSSDYILPLSARSANALKSLAESYRELLSEDDAPSLYDIGYTQSLRRDHHQHRLAVVTKNKQDLITGLTNYIEGEENPKINVGHCVSNVNELEKSHLPLVFVFTGMGPQWWAMGRQLLQKQLMFRKSLEEMDAIFIQLSGWSLLSEMNKPKDESRIAETEVAQPVNFALQVGLAALWKHWGIEPDAIVGHSAGEVAAAYVSGALSIEHAVQVIYHRSRLQQTTSGQGQMMAVGMAAKQVDEILKEEQQAVSIAAINSPHSVTLAGSLGSLVKRFEQLQVFHRLLKVKVPYHSHYMDPLKDELLASLKHIQYQPTQVPLYSTVTGDLIDGQSFDEGYWWKNVRNPVRFADTINQLSKAGYSQFLEIGPHPVLANSISECTQESQVNVNVLPSLHREEDEMESMLSSLGYLYSNGYSIEWEKHYPHAGNLVRMHYPWQHERYWLESRQSTQYRLGGVEHPLLGCRVNAPLPSWQVEIDSFHLPYLIDHKVQGEPIFPGAAYLEMGLQATHELLGNDQAAFSIENLQFHQALFISDELEAPKIRYVMDPDKAVFEIFRLTDEGTWPRLASGRIHLSSNHGSIKREKVLDIQNRCPIKIDANECYQFFHTMGLEYGTCFRGIQRLWVGDNEVLAKIVVTKEIKQQLDQYQAHPAVTDLCLQTLAGVFMSDAKFVENPTLFLPVEIAKCQSFNHTNVLYSDTSMWVYGKVTTKRDDTIIGDLSLLDVDDNPLLRLEGVRLVVAGEQSDNKPTYSNPVIDAFDDNGYSQTSSFYYLQWDPVERVTKEKLSSHNLLAKAWVVFMDQQDVAEQLIKQLESQGGTCIRVYTDQQYKVLSTKKLYKVNPSQRNHFEQLFNDLGNISVEGVVHLCSISQEVTEAITSEQLNVIQKIVCLSALHLIQVISQQKVAKPPKLWFVTKGAQAFDAGSSDDISRPVELAASALWGMVRVMGHRENIENWGGIIDLDPERTSSTQEAQQIFEELIYGDEEDQLAFRDRQRYALRMLETKKIAKSILKPVYRSDSSYLITGGLGGLGLVVARWLVKRGARHLILMARSKLPSRKHWNELHENSVNGRRVAAIRQLEALGATVHLASVDVTNETQLTEFVDDYERLGWPAIRGVIHAAGVAKPQPLNQIDDKDFFEVMDPKVSGAWILHRAFEQVPLDFFVLFSSVASVVAMDGQGNYAAGNAFMDALSHYRRSKGLPSLSINWGPWAEVGLAADLHLIGYFAQRGIYSINQEQGVEMIEQAMVAGMAQITVLSANWPLLAEWYPMNKVPPMIKTLLSEGKQDQEQANESHVEESSFIEQFTKLADTQQRIKLIEDSLIQIVSKVVRLSPSKIDPEASLLALGVDSMMAGELKNHIEKNFKISINLVDLLKGTNFTELATNFLPKLESFSVKEQFGTVDSISTNGSDIDEELGELLNEINQLSNDDQKALLKKLEA